MFVRQQRADGRMQPCTKVLVLMSPPAGTRTRTLEVGQAEDTMRRVQPETGLSSAGQLEAEHPARNRGRAAHSTLSFDSLSKASLPVQTNRITSDQRVTDLSGMNHTFPSTPSRTGRTILARVQQRSVQAPGSRVPAGNKQTKQVRGACSLGPCGFLFQELRFPEATF